MKQLNGQAISTSQHLRDFLLHSDSSEMFCVPPEVVAAQCRLQQQFRDDCVAASCAQLATRQSALVAPMVQASLQPPPGIASVPGSGYSEKQATISTNSSTSGSNGSKGDRYKTELCRTYEECGTCRYGDKCQFAHGFAELRNVARHPKYKTDLCRTFHTSGFCPYGARCHFIHGEQEKPPCAPQQQAATSSSPLLRQQPVPAARRPEVLDLLYADRQNELASFVNTVTSLLSLNGQNQRSQQQPAQVHQTGSHQFQMQTSSSNENNVATYELLRMMVEQQLSITQSKTLLSPCPSPTISQYGSVCSAGSADDIPSPVCSPSLSSSLSSLSSNGNWNAFFKQQASFDSLSSYSNSSGGGSSRRTPPGSPDSQTMHWQDRDAAKDFRLWPSTESIGCSMYEEGFPSRQNALQMKSNLLLSNRAVRSIFSN